MITLTQRLITLLREKTSVDQEIKLKNKEKEEIGRMTLTLKFRANTFEQKVGIIFSNLYLRLKKTLDLWKRFIMILLKKTLM